MREQIVVARYNESVLWLAEPRRPVTLYAKGDFVPHETASVRTIRLENIGREAQSYLWHIVHQWDNLADVTLFCQAGIRDHVPVSIGIDRFFDARFDIVVPWLVCLKEWDDDGRLACGPSWDRFAASGALKRAEMTLPAWFRVHLTLDIEELGRLIYTPGACFSVRREYIKARPLSRYKLLLDCVSHHACPEEAHYMERAWMYLFSVPGVRIKSLT